MPHELDISAVPNDVMLNIISYLDLGSKLRLGQTQKRFAELIHARQMVFPRVFRAAAHEFASRKKLPKPTVSVASYDQELLRWLHAGIQCVLEVVNETKGDEPALNIVNGEDLLACVGRLSMMINPADYAAPDTRGTVPLNWTSGDRLKERHGSGGFKRLLEKDPQRIEKIQKNVASAKLELATVKQTLDEFRCQALWRVYQTCMRVEDKQRKSFGQKIAEKLETSVARSIVEGAFALLLPLLAAPDLLSVASLSRRFLVLAAFQPATAAPADPLRMRLIASLAKRAATMISNLDPKGKPLDGFHKIDLSMGNSFMKTWNQARGNNALLDEVEQAEGSGSDELRNIELRMGDGHAVGLAYTRSVRLMFSQAAQILDEVDDHSAALDLGYKRIVKYLTKRGRAGAEELLAALTSTQRLRSSFFGELALLLVSIEGTQNNMSVLQAPMLADLVAAGEISWANALWEKGVPLFPMAADAKDKGAEPLIRLSKVITKGELPDATAKDADKFKTFLEQHYEVNRRFFGAFFRPIGGLPPPRRLIASALIAIAYLCERFNLSREQRDGAFARLWDRMS
jgi:hypothetical protein